MEHNRATVRLRLPQIVLLKTAILLEILTPASTSTTHVFANLQEMLTKSPRGGLSI